MTALVSTFAAYSATDQLLPRKERTIQASFQVDHPVYVLGIWIAVADEERPNRVLPIYLTREQWDEARKNARKVSD